MQLETPALTPFPRADRPLAQKLKNYFILGKPGIALSVTITALAGYTAGVASNPLGAFSIATLSHTLLGTFLVSMGAGALNMLVEAETDALMSRTKNRPIPTGDVSGHETFFLGSAAASLGVVHLAEMTNIGAAFIASASLVLYLVFYTPMKKLSRGSTVVGAVAGALPPLIGWSASSAPINLTAWSLFAVLFLWQFPHFLALFWLYKEDYDRAGIKTLLADGSMNQTASASFILSLALCAVSLVPYFLGAGRILYLLISIFANAGMIFSSYKFLKRNDVRRAKIFFLATVIYIPIIFLALIFRI